MNRVFKCIENMGKAIAILLFILSAIFILFEVIIRKMTGISFPWLQEFCRYAFVYYTIICVSQGITKDAHTKVEPFKSSIKIARLFDIISNLAVSVFSAVLCFFAIGHLLKMIKIGTITTGLKIPIWLCFIILPIGFFEISIRSLYLACNSIKHKAEKKVR